MQISTGQRTNYLVYVDDQKLNGKSKSELEALVNTARIFTRDKEMKFGLKMCRTGYEKSKENQGQRNQFAKKEHYK